VFARTEVSEFHSLISHVVVPVRIDDVYENEENPAPLTDTLTDPVVAVLPHRCELRVACIHHGVNVIQSVQSLISIH
jgi:hypothetical protein